MGCGLRIAKKRRLERGISMRSVSLMILVLVAMSTGTVFAQSSGQFVITNEYNDPPPGVSRFSLIGTYLEQFATGQSNGVVQMGSQVYVTRTWENRIDKYSTSGILKGSFDCVGMPQAVATLGGQLWVVSWNGFSVCGYTADGTGTTTKLIDSFSALAGITAGADGFLYITSYNSGNVYKWDPSPPSNAEILLHTVAGNPIGLAVDGSDVYVAGNSNGVIYKNGAQWASGLSEPRGMLIYNGKLYVCESATHKIQIFNLSDGSSAGFFGGTVPYLSIPMNMALVVPPAGTLFGTVTLEDYTGDKRLCAVQIELSQGGVVQRTEIVQLDSAGRYEIEGVASGTYDVSFKAAQSLKNVALFVNVPEGGSAECNITLANGDSDGNNDVNNNDVNTVLKNMSN